MKRNLLIISMLFAALITTASCGGEKKEPTEETKKPSDTPSKDDSTDSNKPKDAASDVDNNKPQDANSDAASDQNQDEIAAVKIGNQTWMAKNMAATTAVDGSQVTCYANTDSAEGGVADFVAKYGCLYSFEEAQKVCPAGWHLPTADEFDTLLTSAGTNNNDDFNNANPAFLALIAKDAAWESDFLAQATNSTSFGALPAGSYNFGEYSGLGADAKFWSNTKIADNGYVNYLNLSGNLGRASVSSASPKEEEDFPEHPLRAYSVRCLKD